MSIEWNKVTWYSKATAIVVFVGTLLLGFYLGGEYQRTRIVDSIPVVIENTARIETNSRKVYRDEDYGFEMKYPANYDISSRDTVSGEIQFSTKNPDSPYEFYMLSIRPFRISTEKTLEEVAKDFFALEEFREFKTSPEENRWAVDWIQKVSVGSDIPAYMRRRYDPSREPIYEYLFRYEGVAINVGVEDSFRGFVFNEILSTFRFIESSDITGGKQVETIETFPYLSGVYKIKFYNRSIVKELDIDSFGAKTILENIEEIIKNTSGGTLPSRTDVDEIKTWGVGVEVISLHEQETKGNFDIVLFGGMIDRIFLELDTYGDDGDEFRLYFGNKEYIEGRQIYGASPSLIENILGLMPPDV